MSFRLIEVILPENERESIEKLAKEEEIAKNCLGLWRERLDGDQCLVRILIDSERTEKIMDLFHQEFRKVEGFRLFLLPVEASLPRPQSESDDSGKVREQVSELEEERDVPSARLSREELYTDVAESVKSMRMFLMLVVLSCIVAAAGLIKDSVAVIIGAMVIAPLLGPNMALSLAITLGDIQLARRSLIVNAAGVAVGFGLAFAVGALYRVSPEIPEVASRTFPDLGDIVLALASGSAGALSFTLGVAAALVGVMVAVALVPPLVVAGMLFGSGFWNEAVGAMILTATNVICINLAAVTTFLLQGVRPGTWWEADKAKKATRISILLLTCLLLLLAAVILIWKAQ